MVLLFFLPFFSYPLNTGPKDIKIKHTNLSKQELKIRPVQNGEQNMEVRLFFCLMSNDPSILKTE